MVVLLGLVLIANPIRITYINEFVTSPDSMERIEIAYKPQGSVVDVRGWQVRTSAGLATINSTVLPDSYVVIGRNHLTGPFGLADDSGKIALYQPGSTRSVDSLIYRNHLPMSGASGSRFNQFLFPPDPEQKVRLYIDATPTIGRANNDYGSITGTVRDQDHVPLGGALVEAIGPIDQERDWTRGYVERMGRYYLVGMTKCRFWMRASKTGYSPDVHPDSVNIGEVVDFTLKSISVDENEPVRPGVTSKKTPTLYARSFPLPGEPGTRFEIYNASGYRLSRFQDLRNLTSGIYFLRTTNKGETQSHKIVFIK